MWGAWLLCIVLCWYIRRRRACSFERIGAEFLKDLGAGWWGFDCCSGSEAGDVFGKAQHGRTA